MRSADDELAGRIDVVSDGICISEESTDSFGANAFEHAGDEDFLDVRRDTLLHGFVGIELVVLCADDDGVYALRHVFVAVLNGNLTLRIGAKVFHHFAFATYLCESEEQSVGEVETQRHVVLGLVGSVSEHHALVAGSLHGAI